MKKMKFVVLMILMLPFWKCGTPKLEKFTIKSPFPAYEKEYSEYTVMAENADTLAYNTGTKIYIPKNVWLDSAGNEVKGEVKVNYREFHNAKDIFLAGMSLNYDSANYKGSLETAGMFELRAFKDGKALHINTQSAVKVEMASYDASSNYNFYSLDEKNGKWNYQGTAAPKVNPEIKTINDKIKVLQAKDSFPLDPNKTFAFNYNAALDVYFGNNYSKVYKNYRNKKVRRKINSYGASMSEIYGNRWTQVSYKGIKFYAWQMLWKRDNDKKMPYWVLHKRHNLVTLKYLGNNRYLMTLKNERNKTISLVIKAIMPLKVLYSVPANARKEDYDKVLSEIKKQQEHIIAQAEVYRTFNVKTVGTHNWDRVYHLKQVYTAKAKFTFDNQTNMATIPNVFYFIAKNKSFVFISDWDTDSIMLTPDSSAHYLAVLSPTKVAVFNTKQYNSLDLEKIGKEKNITIPMTTVNVNSLDDIDKLF